MSREQSDITYTPPLRDRSSALGCFHRARGWVLLISYIAVGVLCYTALTVMGDSLQKSPEHAADVGPFVRWMTDHAWLGLLLAIPPAAIGAWLAILASRRPVFWAAWGLGLLWEFGLFAVMLVTFIRYLAPLYEYQPL